MNKERTSFGWLDGWFEEVSHLFWSAGWMVESNNLRTSFGRLDGWLVVVGLG